MPGLSGLETLKYIKDILHNVPIVLITKSEEENIMDMAIGSKIADYLIKPVNPKQILLSIKKLTDNLRLVTEKQHTITKRNLEKLAWILTWLILFRLGNSIQTHCSLGYRIRKIYRPRH